MAMFEGRVKGRVGRIICFGINGHHRKEMRTSNAERRTSNVEVKATHFFLHFDVRRWRAIVKSRG
jgi:hypothetical protein